MSLPQTDIFAAPATRSDAPPVRSVLVIGSGPIVIGQAAEFDYAGTQACRSLREEGVRVILVNSNPATIMTDEDIADAVYIEPLVPEVVRRIIQRERPDGLLPTLGGQTGLNLAVQVAKLGILEEYGVRLLGTPLEAIERAEDRALFKELLEQIGEPSVPSAIVTSVEQAREFAKEVPLPLVIRPAFTLGGTGGGVAHTPEELDRIVTSGITASPIGQILLERSLLGWKEIEYEVMRDGADTCITICNMENLDPMGVHTGDSIVVAPSQTLTDGEYQMLRSSALKIIRALGIEGGCNVQYALDPESSAYSVIEVNPRVSRSSALASKATGYPIARVSAKIAIGRRLDELRNAVTGETTAAFEPALDYVVSKIPRWPFDKFTRADRTISTQMKATGEVMAIDRSFEGSMQKAVRSLETTGKDLGWEPADWSGPDSEAILTDLIQRPNDLRIWAVMAALRRDWTPERIHELSAIDHWFLDKFAGLVAQERELAGGVADNPDLLWRAKRSGFSDRQISRLSGEDELAIRAQRHAVEMVPVYKMVDTCAAEFAARTPYYYSTYEQEDEAPAIEGERAIVVGSGPIRIGQGIEFDYCSVQAARTLREAGVASIMVNSNPETVSTDFDASDRLYFEPLDAESVLEIARHERVAPTGEDGMPSMIVQFGGQTAINLAEPLSDAGAPILGSSLDSIDLAEDRDRFGEFLRGLDIPQPLGATVTSLDGAKDVAERIGYPVLVRPSYVLGGRAMEVVYGADQLQRYVRNHADLSVEHPILVDKYLLGREIEVDAISDGTEVLIPGIMEHIERAGVHSGDSFAVYPAQNVYPAEIATIVDYTTRIALGLNSRGIINIQFVIQNGRVFVLEVNPRSSRTVPFMSKATGVPMVKLATNILLGQSLAEQGFKGGLWPRQPLVAVKAPVFSMAKLRGVEVHLGPEMKSTGEVMGVDRTFEPAFYKALLAAGLALPKESGILLSLADEDKADAIPMIDALVRLGHRLYATEGTAAFLERNGLPVQMATKRIGRGKPDVLDLILQRTVAGVINTPGRADKEVLDGLQIRRAAVERGIPCITSLDTARAMVRAMRRNNATYSVQPAASYRSANIGY
ncbi:MAG TPA: carbamoyl-phosphate synthase large subunit [Thermomicrobiales bacterium]|jgi:carbamoyl-phosphate synthase large subunit|nr:carbamoyl-phosphate synthase large subunit [Thermomicrobiales bacterium]